MISGGYRCPLYVDDAAVTTTDLGSDQATRQLDSASLTVPQEVDAFTATVEELPGHGLLVRLPLHGDVVAGDGATAQPRRAMDRRGRLDLRVAIETLETRLFCDNVGMPLDRSQSWHSLSPGDMALELKGFRCVAVAIPVFAIAGLVTVSPGQ